MKLKTTLACALPLLFAPALVSAVSSGQEAVEAAATDEDRAAVEAAVRDYVEGLYQVAPERIERSVSPTLTKIGFGRARGEAAYGDARPMTFEQLRDLAGKWNVDDRVGGDLTYSIELLDVLDKTACAKLSAYWGTDYMHLMKADDRWTIVHILWQSHPPEQGQ